MAVTDPPRAWRAMATAGVGVQSGWAAAAAALGVGGGQAVEGAFTDEVGFHLRGHAGDHEQHLVGDGGPGGPVQPAADAGEDVQVDLTGVQLVLQQHEEFSHRAGDPVGLVDHQGVAGLEHGEGPAQSGRSVRVLAVSMTMSRQSAAASASSCSWWSWVRPLMRA